MTSVPAIAFDYRPSRTVLFGALAVAALAVGAIVSCGLGLALKFGLAAAAAVYAGYSLRGFLRPPVVRIVWHAAGHWRLFSARGDERPGEFVRAVVLGVLTVLVLRAGPKRTVALILLPDNCDAETRRRLRVRLARANPLDPASGELH